MKFENDRNESAKAKEDFEKSLIRANCQYLSFIFKIAVWIIRNTSRVGCECDEIDDQWRFVS